MILPHTCSILVREQKQKLTIKVGTVAFTVGEIVTGAASHAHGIIESYTHTSGTWAGGDEAGYLIITDITGIFQTSEAITDPKGGTAQASGPATLHTDATGKPYYHWHVPTTSTACRFYTPGNKVIMLDSGVYVDKPLRIMVGSDATLVEIIYRILTTQAGYAGTYDISGVNVRSDGPGAIHHTEATLKKVVT